ncbi:MAG: TIGR01212 family radical SAM protein [Candidatus Eisenbacteria bacterium]
MSGAGRGSLPLYAGAGRFARERFGCEVFRVVVDAGFSCPNRDGTRAADGCRFCTIDGFRPPTSRPDLPIAEQISRALPILARRYPQAGGYLVYFQPYTNTYGPPERLARLLEEARSANGALGVIVGTRPDALPDPILAVLADFNRGSFLQVELGIQSTDDGVLAWMKRGHSWQDSREAIGRLKERDIRVGAHMILGTPWESIDSQVQGAVEISLAGVDAVKLHHLQILRGSALARDGNPARACAPRGSEAPDAPGCNEDPLWRSLPSWQDYARIAAAFLERLSQGIVIERLCALARPGLLIAPRWGVRPERVREEIDRILRARGSRQGRLFEERRTDRGRPR